jgi:hypothetical protein
LEEAESNPMTAFRAGWELVLVQENDRPAALVLVH